MDISIFVFDFFFLQIHGAASPVYLLAEKDGGLQRMQPTDFGKYLLLDRLAVGGMAEVYRGKLIGEQGFEKLVVIKRMLPQIAAKDDMVTAFIEEARLAALLQHENIIHVYDFGEMDGDYFIAMEYLFGQELRALLDKSLEAERRLPLADCLHIAARICDGLHYAHELKDFQQRSLNIIHRDISPQNIFITYDGKIKIIDFGIAKTSLQSVRTQTGLVKGKLAYMSPEQARGSELDRRSDIFATGAVLYEMLTGCKMYQGTDTARVLQKVIEADFPPPETIQRDIPSPVCAILKRALARERSGRYETIGQMLTDIEECMFELSLRASAQTLSMEMKGLFEREYSVETEEIQSGNDADASAAAAITATSSEPALPVGSETATTAVDLDDETARTETIFLPSEQEPVANLRADRSPAVSKVSKDGQKKSGATRRQPDRRSNWRETTINLTVTVVVVASMIWLLFSLKPENTQTPVSEAPPVRVAVQADQQDNPQKPQSETHPIPPQTQTPARNEPQQEKASATVMARAASPGQPPPETRGASEAVSEQPASTPAEGREETKVSPLPIKHIASRSKQVASARSISVESLLANGEKNLKNYRLTTPETDCAYFYFKEALRLDPRNAAARKGIYRIGDAYGRLAASEISRFQYEKAQGYVNTGLKVAPNHVHLLALKKELARPRPLIILEDVGEKVKNLFD